MFSMKPLSHRTGRIAAKSERAAARARRETDIAPLAEHIQEERKRTAVPSAEGAHGGRKPTRKIFLSYRCPWRGYGYARSGRMKGGIAARAITGMGRDPHLDNWKTATGFREKEHQCFISGTKTKEKETHGRHRSGFSKAMGAIELQNAPASGKIQTAAVMAVEAVRTEIGMNQPEARTAGADANVAAAPVAQFQDSASRGVVPVMDEVAPVRIDIQGMENAVAGIPFATTAAINGARMHFSNTLNGIRTEVQITVPRPDWKNEHGSSFAPGSPMHTRPKRAHTPAIRTAADALLRTFGSVPGIASQKGEQQGRSQENAGPGDIAVPAARAPEKTDNSPSANVRTTKQIRADAQSTRTENPEPNVAATIAPARASDGRPEKAAGGPGHLSSVQKKAVYLKTTQGAADAPQ